MGALAGWLAMAAVFSATGQETPKGDDLGELKKKVATQEALIQELLAWKQRAEAGTSNVVTLPDLAPPDEQTGDRFPALQFHGFGAVSYTTSDRAGERSTFALGQLDLFFTSQLAENLDVLGELVVESNDENELALEVERLHLNYRPSDYFNISLGRYHTTIGYYNTAYHHGAWLETAANRPHFLEFEDDGGLLPIHNVGLSVSGRIPSGPLNLHYLVEVGNGRHYSADGEPVLNVRDDNNSKSINVALLARPDAVPGLQAGVSAYYDRLSPEGLPRTGQLILAGHAVWVRPRFEWLNEALWFQHRPEGGDTTQAFAAYTQVARQWGDFRPYLRYQYFYADRNDSIFSHFGEAGLRHGPSAGLRYNFSELAALKLQYDRVWRGGQPAENRFTAQVAFTF